MGLGVTGMVFIAGVVMTAVLGRLWDGRGLLMAGREFERVFHRIVGIGALGQATALPRKRPHGSRAKGRDKEPPGGDPFRCE